jgi:hypothetical protein
MPACGAGQYEKGYNNDRKYVERPSACYRPGQTLPPFEYDVTRTWQCVSFPSFSSLVGFERWHGANES